MWDRARWKIAFISGLAHPGENMQVDGLLGPHPGLFSEGGRASNCWGDGIGTDVVLGAGVTAPNAAPTLRPKPTALDTTEDAAAFGWVVADLVH